jgi:hypothetical protein
MSELTLLKAAQDGFNALSAIGKRGVKLRSEEYQAMLDLHTTISIEQRKEMEKFNPGLATLKPQPPVGLPPAKTIAPAGLVPVNPLQANAEPEPDGGSSPRQLLQDGRPALCPRSYRIGLPISRTVLHLRMSESHVWNFINKGVLRACDIGTRQQKQIRINCDDIDRLMRERYENRDPSLAPLDESWCEGYKQIRPQITRSAFIHEHAEEPLSGDESQGESMIGDDACWLPNTLPGSPYHSNGGVVAH